jgi:hypothetical protein
MMVSGSVVRQVSRFLLCGFGGFRRAVLEAEAVIPGFKNVTAVGETVEQRGRHLGVAEHASPLAEAEISCDDDAGALVRAAWKLPPGGGGACIGGHHGVDLAVDRRIAASPEDLVIAWLTILPVGPTVKTTLTEPVAPAARASG